MSSNSWKRVILGFIFLSLSIFYSILFFEKANFDSTMIFNIAHIKNLSNILVSPVNFDYWNHSGSLINLFSPWLTLLSGLPFLMFNVSYGFTLYLTFLTFLTFVSSYYFMNKFSNNTFESLMFSVMYTFSLNRFYQVFQQQRLENYLVLIFLPMVYYGIFLFFKTSQWKIFTWGLLLTIWTSPYVAIGVIATFIPIVFLIFFDKVSHNFLYWKNFIVNLCKVLVMIVLTTIAFWVPLFEIVLKKNFSQNPIHSVDYLKWYQAFNMPTYQQYLLITIVILSGLLLIMIFLKSNFSYKVLILESILISLELIIPFKIANIDLSRLNFSLKSILSFFILMILSRVIILVFQEGPAILKLGLVIISIGSYGYLNYHQTERLNTQKTIKVADKIDYEKFVINYHDRAVEGQNKFLVNGKRANVSFYTKKNDYWIQYYADKSGKMILPIQNYQGYKVQLNNEAIKTHITKDGTLILKINPNKNVIEVHSQYTLLGMSSLAVNMISFILLIYLSLRKYGLKSKKNPENG